MSTNSPIGLGVVGLGRGFTLTLPSLRACAAVRLVAAFDLRGEARTQFAADFGSRAHASLEALLADPAEDAVYVATPHELHARHAIAAAQAGKHILVEKPMAPQIGECRAMIEAAQAAGVVLVVGPSHGFDAPVLAATGLIASGAYGPIRMISALNFTEFVYRPRRPEELDPRQGGGVVFSQASHQFDVVRRLVGRPVTEITATAANWDAARPGDGAYTALVKFAGGTVATLTYSGYAHFDSDELMGWVSELGYRKDPAVYGLARRALKGLTAPQEAQAKFARAFGAGGPGVDAPPTQNEHFGFVLASCERADLRIMADGIWIFGDETREFLPVRPPAVARTETIMEFVGAVRGERPARQDGHWGLDTIRCCTALVRSSATGAAVQLADLD